MVKTFVNEDRGETEREKKQSLLWLPSWSPTSLFVLLEEPEVRDLFDLNQEKLVKNIQASERAAYISMII